MRDARRILPLAAAIAALAALAACGGEGGETIAAGFEPTAAAPAAYDEMSGEAELTRAEGETTVSISFTGLEPETEYISHLHVGGCAAPEVGGPHFRFDREGPDQPPNEIHMAFESGADGAGEAETTADREVPEGDAGSVVLHEASAMRMAAFVHEGDGHEHSDKVACAELEGLSVPAVGGGDAADADGGSGGSTDRGEGGAATGGPTIVIAAGAPREGIAELTYGAGEEIRFTVESDVAEEIHVHGYDISRDVPAGGSVSFAFPAEIEGIFEVEMEAEGIQIAELRVEP